MSVQLIAWAYAQQTGSASEKAVLIALANRANHDTGRCHPSLRRVAEEVELSYPTVKRAAKSLEDKGYITRSRIIRDDGTKSTYAYSFPGITDAHQVSPRSLEPGITMIPQEPEVNLEPEGPLAAPPRNGHKPRPRNPIWDALTEIFGEATTETAQSRRGKVCRSLAAARASPDEIVKRARTWPLHFEDATLTELALEKHWDTLGRPPLRARR